jgi:RNA polymerase sigma-70 factor (ECF subfamily)
MTDAASRNALASRTSSAPVVRDAAVSQPNTYAVPMVGEQTSVVVQNYLTALAGDSPADALIRGLLESAVRRLHLLCANLLHRSYPRLARPPLNLRPDEMLSAVVERLLKAMRTVRPGTVRQFFALANQHMRWELNDLARRLDAQPAARSLSDVAVAEVSSASELSTNSRRMLDAIDQLPADEHETFNLVRLQGLSHGEVAALLGVSTKTVQRRLHRSLILLADALADLRPGPVR